MWSPESYPSRPGNETRRDTFRMPDRGLDSHCLALERIRVEWNHLILMRCDCGEGRNPPRQRAEACVAFERGLIA